MTDYTDRSITFRANGYEVVQTHDKSFVVRGKTPFVYIDTGDADLCDVARAASSDRDMGFAPFDDIPTGSGAVMGRRVKPGASSGEPYCNAEGGKCGIVLAGTLGLELNGVEFVVNCGDSFAFPSTAMVRFWTVGDETCEVLWVVAPATV